VPKYGGKNISQGDHFFCRPFQIVETINPNISIMAPCRISLLGAIHINAIFHSCIIKLYNVAAISGSSYESGCIQNSGSLKIIETIKTFQGKTGHFHRRADVRYPKQFRDLSVKRPFISSVPQTQGA
jgi:hypothetical protein